MTYKIQKTETNQFEVIELNTNKKIFESYVHDQAYNVYRFLKGGGGFDGFTPDFISKKMA